MAKPLLGKKFWLKYGPKWVADTREQLFFKGKDVHGNSYPAYSTGYAEAKSRGKMKRQANQYKDKNVPILTMDLLRSFKLHKAHGKGFVTGFDAWGNKVKELAEKHGRELTTKDQPLPKQIIKDIERKTKGWIKKRLNKEYNKTTKVTIKTGK